MNNINDQAKRILRSITSDDAPTPAELLEFSTAYRKSIAAQDPEISKSTIVPIAAAWSMLQLGRLKQAEDTLTNTEFINHIDDDMNLSSRDQSLAYAVIAEVLLLGGDIVGASQAARSALYFAQTLDTEGEEMHARGILSATLALNGEILTAKECLSPACADLSYSDDADFSHWPCLLATLLIRTRQDGQALAKELATIPVRPTTNVIVRGIRVYAEVTGRMLRSDFAGACTRCELYRNRLDYSDTPPLFTHLLLGAESLCLLQTGRPSKVTTLLKNAVSPFDHFVCYGLLNASAYISLNNLNKAQEALEPCIAMESSHNGSTRASVLVREAVVNELLGNHDVADAAFFRASDLANREGGTVPPIGLPLEPLIALYERMKHKEPHLSARIEESSFKEYPFHDSTQLQSKVGELSPREFELAQQLASGKTFSEISKETFHSVSTLKTQASSIYRKLGVSSRQEAISVMKSAGFFM